MPRFIVEVNFRCEGDDETLALEHVAMALDHAKRFAPVPPFTLIEARDDPDATDDA